MTVTKVGVVYSIAQCIFREVIVLDHAGADDSEFEIHKSNMKDGEGWLDIPLETFNSFDPNQGDTGNTLQVYIASILGNPSDDKCAVIAGDTDLILAVVAADPRIDSHPDGWLIQDDIASAGWTYDFENAVAVPPP